MRKTGMRPETALKIAAFRAQYAGQTFDRFTAAQTLGKRLGSEFPTWQTLKKYNVLQLVDVTWHLVNTPWDESDALTHEQYNVYKVTVE